MQSSPTERTLSVQTVTFDLPVSKWTSVPLPNDLLNHILLLFWTRDMIGNRVLDRVMFEEDMTKLDPATTPNGELFFCSSFLVNAMLAFSCVGNF